MMNASDVKGVKNFFFREFLSGDFFLRSFLEISGESSELRNRFLDKNKASYSKSHERRKAISHFHLPVVRLDTRNLMEKWCFFFIQSVFSPKVLHLGTISYEWNLFSIKFSFQWVYFQGGKPHRCFAIYIQKWRSYLHSFLTAVLSLSSLFTLPYLTSFLTLNLTLLYLPYILPYLTFYLTFPYNLPYIT